MKNCLLVGAGGFVGSVLRYLIGMLPVGISSGFPIKTLAINVVGAFAIGLISALSEKYAGFPPSVVLMLKAGLCGGFTTFSTFAFETGTLMRGGSTWCAAAYVTLSIILGVAAVFAAGAIVSHLL